MLSLPLPFHLCDIARNTGSYLWFNTKGEEVKLATSKAAVDFARIRHPDCVFVLNTMKNFIPGWTEHNLVAIAAVERSRRKRKVRVYGFIVGGLVPDGTEIPVGHGADDGCVPFDLGEWPGLIVDLPPPKN